MADTASVNVFRRMGRWVGRAVSEFRSGLSNPSLWLQNFFAGGSTTAAGLRVSHDTALRLTAIWCATRILSEAVAALPLHLYHRTGPRSAEVATAHPLYRVLHDKPNRFQTSYDFRAMVQAHLTLRHNAYARIVTDGRGRVTELFPLHPGRVIPSQRPNGTVYYDWTPVFDDLTPETSGSIRLEAEEVLHLRGVSLDGLFGTSPIDTCKESVGSAMAADEVAARFFANGVRPSGIFKHPGKLGDIAYGRLKKELNDKHAGAENAYRPIILEEGMDWVKIGIDPEDAQLLETRKFGVTEIARIFRIPPHMLGDLERATFSNIEHQGLEFVTFSLMPWLVNWEQKLSDSLLLERERSEYFFRFNFGGLLRGDLKARYDAYAVGRQWGWLSVNDIRELEDLNEIGSEGDVYIQPLNMVPAGTPPAQPGQGAAA